MGLFLIYFPKFDMFMVYCQQSFCTWKAKFLLSLPWPLCQLARQDWFPHFHNLGVQFWAVLGGTQPSAPTGVSRLPAQESVDLLECQSYVIDNDIKKMLIWPFWMVAQ